jgi:hypothetical protein
MPSALVVAAIGVLLLGLAFQVRRSSQSVPGGWVVTEAIAVRELHGRAGGVGIEWTTTDGVEVRRFCEGCPADVGDPVRIAYDPERPSTFKALGQYRLVLGGLLVVGVALLAGAAAIGWFLPPAHARPIVRRAGNGPSPGDGAA